MTKRMLIDGTHREETRVVITDGNRLEEYDIETSTKTQLKGNIYLAKVTRVEPSLQAAFVDYGGGRHGFLAFSEIHPDYYQIPIEDREALKRDLAELDVTSQAAQDHVEAIDGDVAEREESPRHDIDEGEDELAATLPGDMADSQPMPVDEGTAGQPGADAEPVEEATPVETEAVTESAEYPAESTVGQLPDAIDPDDASPQDAAPEETVASTGETQPERARPARKVADRRTNPMRRYKIQEVIKRRQILLVQVVKEERGNKGAALTTYLSLAGRYCVLMPNATRSGGGVSRKITNATDRRRLRDLLKDLNVPEGMGVIMRTAGIERNKSEIKRDFDYLMRLWEDIRALTLESEAPALVYEEGDLIKRAIRDLYARDIEEVQVEGTEAYQAAKKLMRMMMPSHAKRVQPYRDSIPLFHRYQVETQLESMHNPVVQLKSGGYIVIDTTEALVAIDVNSGRSTRERNIEETAVKTNLEAATEIARQLRLRDLAGLIVIDFIDMDETRNQRAVEKRFKEAVKIDRARIQLGRISSFGLFEMSRQRLRPSIIETSTELCPHCHGSGYIRSTESTVLHALRMIEEEGIRMRSSEVCVSVPTSVALYILNQKRSSLIDIEGRYGLKVTVAGDDELIPPDMRIDRIRARTADHVREETPVEIVVEEEVEEVESEETEQKAKEPARKRRARRRRKKDATGADTRKGDAKPDERAASDDADTAAAPDAEESRMPDEGAPAEDAQGGEDQPGRRPRRRGRRGGRRRSQRAEQAGGEAARESSPANGNGAARESEDEPAESEPQPMAVEPERPPPAPAHDDSKRVVTDAATTTGRPPRRGWWQRMLE